MIIQLTVTSQLSGGRGIRLPDPWSIKWGRTSRRMGGDYAGSLVIDQELHPGLDVEEIYNKWLGWHLIESLQGAPTWRGRITELALSVDGYVQVKRLDDIYNRVRTIYQTGSGAAEAIVSQVEDAPSLAQYGIRQLVYKIRGYCDVTAAATVRDRLLAQYAQPHGQADQIRSQRELGKIIRIKVEGYLPLTNEQIWNSTSTSNATISAMIEAYTSYLQYVTAGKIDTNGTQASEEVEYQGFYDRIEELVEDYGTASSPVWRCGCWGGLSLDYGAVDLATVHYKYLPQEGRIYLAQSSQPLHPAQVRPGYTVINTGIQPGQALPANLLDDPRVMVIEEVKYQQGQLYLLGAGRDRLTAPIMALNELIN